MKSIQELAVILEDRISKVFKTSDSVQVFFCKRNDAVKRNTEKYTDVVFTTLPVEYTTKLHTIINIRKNGWYYFPSVNNIIVSDADNVYNTNGLLYDREISKEIDNFPPSVIIFKSSTMLYVKYKNVYEDIYSIYIETKNDKNIKFLKKIIVKSNLISIGDECWSNWDDIKRDYSKKNPISIVEDNVALKILFETLQDMGRSDWVLEIISKLGLI